MSLRAAYPRLWISVWFRGSHSPKVTQNSSLSTIYLLQLCLLGRDVAVDPLAGIFPGYLLPSTQSSERLELISFGVVFGPDLLGYWYFLLRTSHSSSIPHGTGKWIVDIYSRVSEFLYPEPEVLGQATVQRYPLETLCSSRIVLLGAVVCAP